jgi:predicted Rossmann-fold nucleotide-binding protein
MIVGGMASGKNKPLNDEERRLAREVGTSIANLGYHLLTGGGGGLMKAGGQAFLEKKRKLLKAKRQAGNLISILRAKELPHKKDGKRTSGANADNGLGEIVIRTHLPYSGKKASDPLSRNHINALTADLVVILPGGAGTLSELQLAFEYGKTL